MTFASDNLRLENITQPKPLTREEEHQLHALRLLCHNNDSGESAHGDGELNREENSDKSYNTPTTAQIVLGSALPNSEGGSVNAAVSTLLGRQTATDLDYLQLSVLEERYNRFLDLGVKALREQGEQLQRQRRNGGKTKLGGFAALFNRGGQKKKKGTVASSGSTSNNSAAPTSPLSPQSSSNDNNTTDCHNKHHEQPQQHVRDNGDEGVSDGGAASTDIGENESKHWTWVTDLLIVGACPVATGGTAPSDPSAHLVALGAEAQARDVVIGLVVSAVQDDEMAALGDFAGPEDWETILGVEQFLSCELPSDATADGPDLFTVTDLISICDVMDQVVEQGQAIYIHDVAGRFRAFLILMSYVVVIGHMPYEATLGMWSVIRPNAKLTARQIEYAGTLAEKLQSEETAEEHYRTLLENCLTLPPDRRKRLMEELALSLQPQQQ